MDQSKGKERVEMPQLAGNKRPAPTVSPPSLLPAIDFTSSPRPRSAKRQALFHPAEFKKSVQVYPTPVPSSEIGFLPSSPPQRPATRPSLQRTASTASERAPLAAVASVVLEDDGTPLCMGRSSNSSHYQLSTNRLISRVHIQARYIPAIPHDQANKVEVTCLGWNGVVLHSEGRTWTLGKGDTFTTGTEGAEVMIDVQDARVMIEWPLRRSTSLSTISESAVDSSPSRLPVAAPERSDFSVGFMARPGIRLHSPVSPTARHGASSSTFFGSDAILPAPHVEIYEDAHSSDVVEPEPEHIEPTQSTQKLTQTQSIFSQGLTQESQGSSIDSQDFSDQDEENDPIIQSFGPQGDNLLPRMASLVAGEEHAEEVGHEESGRAVQHLELLQRRSESASTNEAEHTALINHVVNQLAFSRLSSTLLSSIMSQLPAELKGDDLIDIENKGLTSDQLKNILDGTSCIGRISREGKDAAGKQLESEYYYIPTEDKDEKRRDAVVEGLQKPGLRACRKQHKVGAA
jgi:hypothetical protein